MSPLQQAAVLSAPNITAPVGKSVPEDRRQQASPPSPKPPPAESKASQNTAPQSQINLRQQMQGMKTYNQPRYQALKQKAQAMRESTQTPLSELMTDAQSGGAQTPGSGVAAFQQYAPTGSSLDIRV